METPPPPAGTRIIDDLDEMEYQPRAVRIRKMATSNADKNLADFVCGESDIFLDMIGERRKFWRDAEEKWISQPDSFEKSAMLNLIDGEISKMQDLTNKFCKFLSLHEETHQS
jgi:hypothetical protein